jgi:hypothetical protein
MASALFNQYFPHQPPTCTLSPCGKYRYILRLPIGTDARTCCFVMANPSTAIVMDGEFQSDPTVTRCINYARSWGYGRLLVVNVRAWRETNPKLVPPDPEAIGEDNDAWIQLACRESDLVVCAWGKLGGVRGLEVLRIMRFGGHGRAPHALKLNGDGSPCHPLYLDKTLKPFPMESR